MIKTAPSSHTSPAMAVHELYKASPRWVTGFGAVVATLLAVAAIGSTIG